MDRRASIINGLKTRISGILLPIIGKKCILVDAPYYENIGDVLIWAGTRQFLLENKIETLYTCSRLTCSFPSIDKNVTILFQGGGNLGDIYPEHSDFLLNIIKHYPDNRVIILPQTIYYSNNKLEYEHFEILRRHRDLFVCARDKVVFDHIRNLIPNRTLLVPDMAFFISKEAIRKFTLSESKENLYIVRNDAERSCVLDINLPSQCEKRDWPTMESLNDIYNIVNRLIYRLYNHSTAPLSNILCRLWDYFALHCYQLGLLKTGVRFISPYRQIYTTRLHGCILSFLLGKQIFFYDNSYGKNSAFYHTWLSDDENVTLIPKK